QNAQIDSTQHNIILSDSAAAPAFGEQAVSKTSDIRDLLSQLVRRRSCFSRCFRLRPSRFLSSSFRNLLSQRAVHFLSSGSFGSANLASNCSTRNSRSAIMTE